MFSLRHPAVPVLFSSFFFHLIFVYVYLFLSAGALLIALFRLSFYNQPSLPHIQQEQTQDPADIKTVLSNLVFLLLNAFIDLASVSCGHGTSFLRRKVTVIKLAESEESCHSIRGREFWLYRYARPIRSISRQRVRH